MYRTAEETACILAVILNRSGQSRARLSAKTVKFVGGRKHLRSAYVVDVTAVLADRFGWLMAELDGGGYGAVQVKALVGAKPVKAVGYLDEEEMRALRKGTLDAEALASREFDDEADQEDAED